MKGKQALEFFKGDTPKMNCTQSVLKVFQSEAGFSDKVVEAASTTGGGKVEGGFCGALLAARVLVGESVELTEIERVFKQETGSLRCDRILSVKRRSCDECVSLIVRLLESCPDVMRPCDSSFRRGLEDRAAAMLHGKD